MKHPSPMDPAPKIPIRDYQPGDLRAAQHCYLLAVTHIDAGLYSKNEITAWAQWGRTAEALRQLLGCGWTRVAIAPDGAMAAFAQLFPANRINMLYVNPAWSRQGLGGRMIVDLELLARQIGQTRLETHASLASAPVFERQGFVPVHQDSTEWQGEQLQRWQMVKTLKSEKP